MTRLLVAVLLSVCVLAQSDPPPSWNDGAAKRAITQFVHTTTDPSNANFVFSFEQ